MAIDERRRLEMFERLGEVLGIDVAETLLAHLPPHGERVATEGQVEQLRIATSEQMVQFRASMTEQMDEFRASTEARFEETGAETRRLLELQDARLTASWRRDLLLLAAPQFLVLLGIILSLNL